MEKQILSPFTIPEVTPTPLFSPSLRFPSCKTPLPFQRAFPPTQPAPFPESCLRDASDAQRRLSPAVAFSYLRDCAHIPPSLCPEKSLLSMPLPIHQSPLRVSGRFPTLRVSTDHRFFPFLGTFLAISSLSCRALSFGSRRRVFTYRARQRSGSAQSTFLFFHRIDFFFSPYRVFFLPCKHFEAMTDLREIVPPSSPVALPPCL